MTWRPEPSPRDVETTAAAHQDVEMNSEGEWMENWNARRRKHPHEAFQFTHQIKWSWCMRHLLYESVLHKTSMNWRVFYLFHFLFYFHAILISKWEMVNNCILLSLLASIQIQHQELNCEFSCWRHSACVCTPLACSMGLWLEQSLLEGEPGPPTTLVQAAATEAEKQMLYELERTAEEKKKITSLLIPKYRT